MPPAMAKAEKMTGATSRETLIKKILRLDASRG
jgi:hypothetical protein